MLTMTASPEGVRLSDILKNRTVRARRRTAWCMRCATWGDVRFVLLRMAEGVLHASRAKAS